MKNLFDDYLKATRDMQKMWENSVSQMMEEFVKSQTYVHAMASSLEASLDSRKMFDNTINRWADLFGIVTKKDVDTINRQVYDQNVRLEKMVELLSDIRDGMAQKQAPGPVVEQGKSRKGQAART